MKVTKLLNKIPKCQLVQIMLLSEEAEEIYRGKVENIEDGLKIDNLKVDGVCTFSSCDDTITIFVTMK
jgi:hypothetical protein